MATVTTRVVNLRIETLEDRLAPAAYTVNDPSNDGAADPTKNAQTSNGTFTLRSILDRAAKTKESLTISFSGPMDITASFMYFTAPVKMIGTRLGDAPAVTIHGNIAVGSNSTVQDMHVVGAGGAGIYCQNNNTIKNNVVEGSGSYGICAAGSGNKITGNYVGLTTSGNAANPNLNGVLLFGANNILGGTATTDRNVISGNTQAGVVLAASTSNRAVNCIVIGNYIGTSADGTQAIANGTYGVSVQGIGNRIGGLKPSEGNLIVAANGGLGGIQVSKGSTTSSGNKLLKNLIGTKADGLSMFTPEANDPGAQVGIAVGSGTVYTVIQGNTVADFDEGIKLSGGVLTGTQVVGNQVGVGSDSQAKLRNRDGLVLNGVSNVRVGGSSAGTRNTIAANQRNGIVLTGYANDNQIYGNYIGTNFADDDLGNGVHGIHIQTGSRNFIGTTSSTGALKPTFANTIAYNGFDPSHLLTADERGHAVQIDDDVANTQNTLRGNYFHDNKALSIYLADLDHANELPQNDVAQAHYDAGIDRTVIDQLPDHDTGPNNLQNFPVFTSIDKTGQMVWELNTNQANATYTIDFYTADERHDLGYGQATKFLTTKMLQTNTLGNGKITIPFTAGQHVAAIATDRDGNSSTFSIVDGRGDGIADAWITKGIDFDMTGNSLLSLPNADLTRKNLFVQMDVMSGVVNVSLSNVFNKVQQAFNSAPVQVPGGGSGINLQINPGSGPNTLPFSANYANAWTDFSNTRNNFFGVGLSDVQKKAKALVYRYGAFINQFDGSGSSGLAEATIVNNPKAPNGKGYQALGGNDFMVALPSTWWNASPTAFNTVTEDDLAGTMMHEFGHTLGLLHGGTELENYKPNYYSIMNYSWQMPGILHRIGVLGADYSSSWSLDYSRQALRAIDENATGAFNIGFDASKQVPVARLWQTKTGWYAPPQQNQFFGLVPMSGAVPRVTAAPAFAKALGITGRADLNYDDFFAKGRVPTLSRLNGAEDWSNILFNFRESPSNADGQHGSEVNELNNEDIGQNLRGPQMTDIVVTGADAGDAPRVQVYNPDGSIAYDFEAFASSFLGGVRVAKGDVNGDTITDIIAAMGPGGDTVSVFNGATGTLMYSVQPYGVGFTGGVNVAVGDVDGDAQGEIIVAPASGTGSTVKVLTAGNGAEERSVTAFSATLAGGLSVAVGDVNGDGKLDILAGMASGAKPQVKVFDGVTLTTLKSFTVLSAAYNGVNLAAADMDGDGKADIIVGAGTSTTSVPLVSVYSGANPSRVILRYYADDPSFHGGVRVAVVRNEFGEFDIVTATGPGKAPSLRRFSGLSIVDMWHTDLFDNTFDGAFIA